MTTPVSDPRKDVPVYQQYMNPVLDVLRREGRPLANDDIERLVVAQMKIPDSLAAIAHDPEKPGQSEVGYRISWARSYLKKAKLIENPRLGEWQITETGKAAGEVDAFAIAAEVVRRWRERRDTAEPDTEDELPVSPAETILLGELATEHRRLASAGELFDPRLAREATQRFRERFGPEALARLDGEALLIAIHGRRQPPGLAYWLEFKDDDEFPGLRFGSISGGSAMKFGIYQAQGEGHWMGGSPRQPHRLSIDEAIQIARLHRDELVSGARILESYGDRVDDYRGLQDKMVQAAPELAGTAWGHKYFYLLFPSLLAPLHSEGYQEVQIVKLLQEPGSGRYENDGIVVRLARELRVTPLELAAVLHRRSGGLHQYWRVGTANGDDSEWPRMRAGGFAAIGWDLVGDLSDIEASPDGRQRVKALVATHYPGPAEASATRQLFDFVVNANERDLVVAMQGATVLAIGRVTGPYRFQSGDGPFAHRRSVEWLDIENWSFPSTEDVLPVFVKLRKPRNRVAVEERLLLGRATPGPAPSSAGAPGPRPEPSTPAAFLPPLDPMIAHIRDVLSRKRQVILYGPPGTGKTYWAQRAVSELVARNWFGVDAGQLNGTQQAEVKQAVRMCAFHAAYGYEDFLEGYRPRQAAGGLSFELRDGVFKDLCTRAAQAPNRHFFLIIDEINRGDVPRIFGELLTVLEKRNQEIVLPLSGSRFSVPENVFVIGTMNTADRSIALLDAALRRRFGFIELLPDSVRLGGASVGGLPLGPWLDELNRRIVQHLGRDARHLQIGHSYLMMPDGRVVPNVKRFVEILRDDIIPLLEEYCYENLDALTKILGRIDKSLFSVDRHDDLMNQLRSTFASIMTAPDAVAAVHASDDEDEAEEEAAAE